ncbi:MAG: hypothetical protein LBF95_07100 [Treponema sp.]|jgi:hypothetical protein|nr:hypothetical protein [Treponema sp.]
MEKPKLIAAVLTALLLVHGGTAEAQTRNDPINVNLVIDGSRYTQDLGGEIAEWICAYVIDGILLEGDYLRIHIAADKVRPLYSGVFDRESGESIKALLRAPLPGTETADFAGALGDIFSPVAKKQALMTYTLLISTPLSLSPVRLEAVISYLRFSRVMEFPGWRALVLTPDTGPRAREAAEAFLAGR